MSNLGLAGAGGVRRCLRGQQVHARASEELPSSFPVFLSRRGDRLSPRRLSPERCPIASKARAPAKAKHGTVTARKRPARARMHRVRPPKVSENDEALQRGLKIIAQRLRETGGPVLLAGPPSTTNKRELVSVRSARTLPASRRRSTCPKRSGAHRVRDDLVVGTVEARAGLLRRRTDQLLPAPSRHGRATSRVALRPSKIRCDRAVRPRERGRAWRRHA